MKNRFIAQQSDKVALNFWGQSLSEQILVHNDYHLQSPSAIATTYKEKIIAANLSYFSSPMATETEMVAAIDKLSIISVQVKGVRDFLKSNNVQNYTSPLYEYLHLGYTLIGRDIHSWVNDIFWNKNPLIKGIDISNLPDKKEIKKYTSLWTEIFNDLSNKLVQAKDFLVMNSLLSLAGAIPLKKSESLVGYASGKYGSYSGLKRNSKIGLESKLLELRSANKITLTDDELDLFVRISRVETSGFVQVLNSYDYAVMSIGFLQLTYHTGKLQWLIKMAPDAFKKYGIEIDEARAQKKYKRYDGSFQPPLKNLADKNDLRWGIWAERFYYAGLDEDILIKEVELAKTLLKGQYEGFSDIDWFYGSWKSGLKDLYPWFKRYYDDGDNYLKALLQETYNNNPQRAVTVFKEAFSKLEAAEKTDWKAFLEKFKASLEGRSDHWKDYPSKLSGGAQLIAPAESGELSIAVPAIFKQDDNAGAGLQEAVVKTSANPFGHPEPLKTYLIHKPEYEKCTYKYIEPIGQALQWWNSGSRSFTTQITITKPVGKKGGKVASETQTVRERLEVLGFSVINFNSKMDKLEQMIRFFQGIINGHGALINQKTGNYNSGVDGTVDTDGTTIKWLNAANAPNWVAMDDGNKDARAGLGYYNFEKTDSSDGDFYYGTDWMTEFIKCAGKKYNDDYLASNTDKSVMWINDLSLKSGFKKQHATHQTGMGVDVRLPHKTGGESSGITHKSDQYDRDATRAMIQAFRACDGHNGASLKVVYFNDPELIKEGICTSEDEHDNHFHVSIAPPELVAP